jgi:hypothetical protein
VRGGDGFIDDVGITALHDRARDQPRRRVLGVQGHHTPGDAIEAAFHAPDAVVHRARAVEGNDDRIDAGGDIGRVTLDQQASGDERDANAQRLQLRAQRPQVAMQQRLSAGQHHALHAQGANRLDMP